MPAKRVAVVLSGCGHKDGTEITEAVSTILALSETGAEYDVFTPDIQFNVRDSITAAPTNEYRSLVQESARISRGRIRPLTELNARNFEALAIPGGAGAILNLSTWAKEGAKCTVDKELERVLNEFYSLEKPICAICVAPAVVARVLGSKGITITLGAASEVSAEAEKTGAIHEVCAVDDFVTDREHRVITTPAYMYDRAKPFEVYTGIRKAILELVEMA